jgi:heme A synthase
MTYTRRLSWTLIVLLVGLVMVGALVRATGSGAGCGTSWPVCQGQIVPELKGATAIEYSHRAFAVAIGLVGIALLVAVFRNFPKGHAARKAVVWTAAFYAVENLLGLLIIFYQWVADDASVARVISVPLHLVNTLVLLAAATLTTFFVAGGGRTTDHTHRKILVAVAIGLMLIAGTGGVTALADTLFPKDGFTIAGIFDVQTSEHFLTRLRIVHPFVSIAVGLFAAWWASRRTETSRAARIVVGAVVGQIALGFLNVVAGTPVWLSLIHVMVADVLWVAWVWLGAEVSQHQPVPVSA